MERSDAPAGSSWGLFDDSHGGDLGTLSLLTSDRARRGAACVLTGERFALNYEINAFNPPLLDWRDTAKLSFSSRHAAHLDDVIDGFNPQTSSQIDGLRHRRHEDHGYYNGAPDPEDLLVETRLGVQQWAEAGIAGRAVLLDIERTLAPDDANAWHLEGASITTSDLDETVARQGVSLEHGDIVLLHTGWAGWYVEDVDETVRRECRSEGRFTGLTQSRGVLEWLWDHGVALLATDTFAVERIPAVPDSPFSSASEGGMMHQELLALLGMALGELWRLRPLARTCALDGRWECLLTSAPLNVPGGVSTPANALAIR